MAEQSKTYQELVEENNALRRQVANLSHKMAIQNRKITGLNIELSNGDMPVPVRRQLSPNAKDRFLRPYVGG